MSDPTRTLTIRKAFDAEVYRRMRAIKGLIRKSIVTNDAFGLRINAAALPSQFNFPTNPEKVAGFMAWLKDQTDAGLVNTDLRGGRRLAAARAGWMNVYIESAYKKGIKRGRTEINKRKKGDKLSTESSAINAAWNKPTHADRAGLAYIRVYDGLAGITETMSQQISGVLAQGLIDGKNPLAIARELNDRVDAIGITRARTLARTEVIRAHHSANIQEYREAGAVGVNVQAEWLTAGDDRVCERCAALEGKQFGLSEIESMIPVHPNCRCVALPILE